MSSNVISIIDQMILDRQNLKAKFAANNVKLTDSSDIPEEGRMFAVLVCDVYITALKQIKNKLSEVKESDIVMPPDHAKIFMKPVQSSNLEAIGYDKTAKLLKVRFAGGSEYVYEDVPDSTFTELQLSESVGSYFSSNVRTSFKFRKVK